MIDGEGSVVVRRDGKGMVTSRTVMIVNTDASIVEAVEAACTTVGIEYSKHRRVREGEKPLFGILICGRANLERLLEAAPPRSIGKLERLQDAVTSYKQRHHRRDQIPADRLRQLYVDARMSGPEVAVAMGVPQTTLYGWLERLGIERRGRWR